MPRWSISLRCDGFDVRIEHSTVGDYCLGRGVVVVRKTHTDFAISLADGRLSLQAARLAKCPHRPVVLLEGPRPARMPGIYPHALKGAMASLAVKTGPVDENGWPAGFFDRVAGSMPELRRGSQGEFEERLPLE